MCRITTRVTGTNARCLRRCRPNTHAAAIQTPSLYQFWQRQYRLSICISSDSSAMQASSLCLFGQQLGYRLPVCANSDRNIEKQLITRREVTSGLQEKGGVGFFSSCGWWWKRRRGRRLRTACWGCCWVSWVTDTCTSSRNRLLESSCGAESVRKCFEWDEATIAPESQLTTESATKNILFSSRFCRYVAQL